MEQLPFLLVLIIACWLDLTTHKIPNWLTLPFIPFALLYHALFGLGLLFSLVGLGLAFGLLFPAFMLRFLAGGDVKLVLVLGAWLGWQLLLESLLYGLMFGLPLTLILGWQRVGWQGVKQTCVRYGYVLGTRKYMGPLQGELAGLKVPYGPALALGAMLAMVLNHFDLITLIS
ncbi:A24 family peptidase [Oceanisphaera sp.]|uniref:A24 family peptidase n=1 Tax=Oceanisphaera sp. TaxID=1929979 RepID=UPI003A9359CC